MDADKELAEALRQKLKSQLNKTPIASSIASVNAVRAYKDLLKKCKKQADSQKTTYSQLLSLVAQMEEYVGKEMK